jgi:hypothetical protein
MRRNWYADDAGPWTAYQAEPEHAEHLRRLPAFPWGTRDGVWTSNAAEADRFDTKAEAEAWIRSHAPRRRGVVRKAVRVTEAQRLVEAVRAETRRRRADDTGGTR